MLSVQSPNTIPSTDHVHPSTFQPTVEESEIIVQAILKGYADFLKLPNWEPSPRALEIYLGIYNILAHDKLSADQELKVLTDPRVTSIQVDLHRIFNTLQCNFEEDFAERIIAAPTKEDAQKVLNSYPGVYIYDFLVRMEMNAVATVIGQLPTKIAMLGSGPLPMTSMRIIDRAQATKHRIEVLAVDIDSHRIEQSVALLNKFGGYEDITHAVADCRYGPDNLAEYDAVYFATLIGETIEEREDILLSVANRMKPGAVLITRMNHGLKTVMYPVPNMESKKFGNQIQPVLEVRSKGDVHGSIVISRVAGRV